MFDSKLHDICSMLRQRYLRIDSWNTAKSTLPYSLLSLFTWILTRHSWVILNIFYRSIRKTKEPYTSKEPFAGLISVLLADSVLRNLILRLFVKCSSKVHIHLDIGRLPYFLLDIYSPKLFSLIDKSLFVSYV